MVRDREAWYAAVHGVTKSQDMTRRPNNNKEHLYLSIYPGPFHQLLPPTYQEQQHLGTTFH